MIKNIKGDKVTPKQKAQDILQDWLFRTVDGWGLDWNQNNEHLTDKESEEVHKQLIKLVNRTLRNI